MPGLPVQAQVERVYREESRRILATLIRLLGDFDLAEEALHEAFFVAVEIPQQTDQRGEDAPGLTAVDRLDGRRQSRMPWVTSVTRRSRLWPQPS